MARELIGAYLVRRLAGGVRLVGRLVEVEAYLGDGSDPASHSHKGPTRRNRSMFGPPGRLYVYRSYGIHLCANAVCEEPGRAAAVLLRALEPVEGDERMRALRGLPPDTPARAIASGPGRLTQAFGLELADDGRNLLSGPLSLRARPTGARRPRVASSPRVGISRAVALPYRFFDPDSDCVSRSSRPRTRRRAG